MGLIMNGLGYTSPQAGAVVSAMTLYVDGAAAMTVGECMAQAEADAEEDMGDSNP